MKRSDAAVAPFTFQVPVLRPCSRSSGAKGEDLLDAAVRENVKRVVTRLRTSDAVLVEPIRAGRVKVVGARYDLDDGEVEFFTT